MGAFTDTYTANAADAEKTITIQLTSSGSQGDYDNVVLSATPEPATLVMFGSALAADVTAPQKAGRLAQALIQKARSGDGLVGRWLP